MLNNSEQAQLYFYTDLRHLFLLNIVLKRLVKQMLTKTRCINCGRRCDIFELSFEFDAMSGENVESVGVLMN